MMTMKEPANRRKAAIVALAALFVIIASFAVREFLRFKRVAHITGAIISDNKDPHLQRPISNATVTIRYDSDSWKSVSEVSGLFRIRLNPAVPTDEPLNIRVEHADYHPLATTMAAKDQIYVIRLTPKLTSKDAAEGRTVLMSNVRVRYATRSTSTTTIGSAVRTFDVVNAGNVECGGRPPCSPDGKWKATVRSFSLDTEEQQKHFRNVRVSCIAGPCPFSRIEQDRFSRGGRNITVSVRNWSDPVTYVVEAEVAMTMESELIRHTYPVTFGRTMNFTLPSVASGVSIEAEVDGAEVVFPLGPELRLSWATCRFEVGTDGAKQFRCELKPGYRFER
jgi:hypothetical protein